jgi:hypothetical protein
MHASLTAYLEDLVQNRHLQAVLVYDGRGRHTALSNGADLVSVVIVNEPQTYGETRYLLVQDQCLEEYQISSWQVERWMVSVPDRRFVYLLHHADVLYDPQHSVPRMKEKLAPFVPTFQKIRICEEYSRYLQHYLEAKELAQQELLEDAFHSVSNALNGWARLAVLEAGEEIGPSVWLQVKNVDVSIYKLYEELILGKEPLAKRIELLLLPIEFSIVSNIRSYTGFLLDVLSSEPRPWTIEDLMRHPLVAQSEINLPMLLRFLVRKQCLREIPLPNDKGMVTEYGYMAV